MESCWTTSEGGRDLELGIVRAIGSPGERFAEDKLRMLRAVRFAARFGSALNPRPPRRFSAWPPQIRQVSSERVRDELSRC